MIVSFQFRTAEGGTPSELFSDTLPGGPRGVGEVVAMVVAESLNEAKDAAELVAYCNAPVGTHPMADLRAEHGYPEPFGVRYPGYRERLALLDEWLPRLRALWAGDAVPLNPASQHGPARLGRVAQ